MEQFFLHKLTFITTHYPAQSMTLTLPSLEG